MKQPVIAVFAGGISPEREVSLGSGQACADALARSFPTKLYRIDAATLPTGLDPKRELVFSTLHGTFGEDGGMQRLLDAAGATYAGCDAASSELTMDKTRTKAAAGVSPFTRTRGRRLTRTGPSGPGNVHWPPGASAVLTTASWCSRSSGVMTGPLRAR